MQDMSQGSHIIQRLREANQAIAVPTLPTAGEGQTVAQSEEAKTGLAKEGESLKKDAAEMLQGQASTGNSSNHNPAGSPPTDTPVAPQPQTVAMSTRNSNHHHVTSNLPASFNPTKAIRDAMAKVVTSQKEKYPRSMPVIQMNLRYKPMP